MSKHPLRFLGQDLAGSTLSLATAALLAVGLSACAKPNTLSLKPTTPADPELVPAQELQKSIYKKLLLLPLESGVTVKVVDGLEPATLKKESNYFTAKLERALLAQGFQVISPVIVARAQKGIKGGARLSAAEKALIMGKETKADAVFMIQALGIYGAEDFYLVDNLKTQRVEKGRVKPHKKKKGRYYHTETEECVYRVPYYEIRMEGKMIDARSGNVLWVGTARHQLSDAFRESWVAKLDKDCELLEQNFIYSEYLKSEQALDNTYGGLVASLINPMKEAALAGQPLVRAEDKPKPKPEPKPKPKPEPKPKPKKKTAVVSAKKASLRAGPGRRNQRLRYVPRKSKVQLLETMGEWSKVKLQDGGIGWMHDSTIIVND